MMSQMMLNPLFELQTNLVTLNDNKDSVSNLLFNELIFTKNGSLAISLEKIIRL